MLVASVGYELIHIILYISSILRYRFSGCMLISLCRERTFLALFNGRLDSRLVPTQRYVFILIMSLT